MPIQYPEPFKHNVVHRYEKGESIKNLSQELNIAQNTIYHWRKLYSSICRNQEKLDDRLYFFR